MAYPELYEALDPLFNTLAIVFVMYVIIEMVKHFKNRRKQKAKRRAKNNNKYIIAKSVTSGLKQEYIGQKAVYFNELLKMM